MNSSTPTKSPQSMLFVIFAFLGTFINLVLGFIFTLISLSEFLIDVNATLPPPTWWAIAFGFLALCGVPSIIYGVRNLQNKEDITARSVRYSFLLAIPMLFSGLLLGYLAFSIDLLPSILGPLAKIVVAASAALFAIQIVQRFGPDLTKRRIWAQFVIGIWVVPLFALVIEFLTAIPTLILFGLGALTSQNGRLLLNLLQETPSPSVEALTEAANGIILEPWFIVIVLGFFAVLVPLIEEGLKTMAVWPWITRRRSSLEAFIGGVIGGAGYALFEATFLTQAAPTWLPTTVGRAGATIMHAFTTGVASWGLSQGIGHKNWGRMVISYLIAVTFHGLWNAGALSIALIDVRAVQSGDLSITLGILNTLIPLMIFTLTISALLGLSQLPKRLRSLEEPAPLEVPTESV